MVQRGAMTRVGWDKFDRNTAKLFAYKMYAKLIPKLGKKSIYSSQALFH